jgi:hypothetical protein
MIRAYYQQSRVVNSPLIIERLVRDSSSPINHNDSPDFFECARSWVRLELLGDFVRLQ